MLPNIIFITCHDLGRHLGCYGQESVQSEALDQLARQGVSFDSSFCTAPQCSPSRAALHTGRHAHSVGVLGLAHSPFNWHLHPDQMHMARRLREAGYDCTLVGMQHVTHSDKLHALGYEHVLPLAPAPALGKTAQQLIAAKAQRNQPFYLEIGFFEPHRPYNWGGAEPDSTKGVNLPPYIPDAPEAIADFAALQGMIQVMDNAIADIFASLEKHDLAQETLIIFTTDHGLAMPRAKCTLYDPGLETSLIMRWPSRGISGGRRYAEMISHVDIVPTMLEALGLPVPDNLHGRSFWPLLQGRDYEPREAVFAEKTYHTHYEPMRAIRTPTHKLIINFDVGMQFDVPSDICQSPIYPLVIDQQVGERPHIELYDLETDPNESINLAGRPEMAGLERSLINRLRKWMVDTGDPLLKGPVASPFYEDALRRLMMVA